MKNLFVLLVLFASVSAFAGAGCDDGGYNSDGISCERAAADAAWDAAQDEFDQPND